MPEYDILVKIVMVGDTNTGKSSLLRTMSGAPWVEHGQPTVGVDFVLETVEVGGKKLKLQIWDTAGQEKYSAIRGAYFRGAHCVAVCFDITSKHSFDHIKHWVSESRMYVDHRAAIMLIGTKSDLSDSRQVPQELIDNILDKADLETYVETSAKTDQNVKEAFRALGSLGLDTKLVLDKAESAVDHTSAVSLSQPVVKNAKSGGRVKRCLGVFRKSKHSNPTPSKGKSVNDDNEEVH